MSANSFAPDVALDALFRRNAATHPDMIALAGADGTTLTYAQAGKAVGHLAEQIAAFGLPAGSSVGLLLPNGNELVLSLLAAMQCGHVAVALPVAWRKADLVRACRDAEAAALITTANFASEDLPLLAGEVAVEVFELSFPCAFGTPLPDGIAPLALSTEAREAKSAASAAPGIATMQASPGGSNFVLHRDEELLAAGLGAMLASDMQAGDHILSAVSLSNYAGLSSAFVPWLLCGGTLTLLTDIPSAANIPHDARRHAVAHAGVISDLCVACEYPFASVAAVHFSGMATAFDTTRMNAAKIVDVIAFSEVCVIAMPRKDREQAQPIPLGAFHAGNGGAGAPVILETSSSETGHILLRGAMIPKEVIGSQDWLDTGYTADVIDGVSFSAKPPADLLAIGALRFSLPELERRILAAALVSGVEVVSDDILGNTLIIWSERPEQTAKALLDAGLPRVIAQSVRKAENVRARTA